MRNASGVDFSHYKQPTIKRRLQRRMLLHKITSLEQYVKFLQANPGEVTSLYQDILIHVTRFFRKPESFKVLEAGFSEDEGGPAGRDADSGVGAGMFDGGGAVFGGDCAAGIAGGRGGLGADPIFATDVSEAAIEHARTGVYPESISEDVSADRLRRFFNKTDGSYRVGKMVRDCACLRAGSDARSAVFPAGSDCLPERADLSGAGAAETADECLPLCTETTGFLMLGGAETVGPYVDLFGVADKRHKLYLRRWRSAHGHGLSRSRASRRPRRRPRRAPSERGPGHRFRTRRTGLSSRVFRRRG